MSRPSRILSAGAVALVGLLLSIAAGVAAPQFPPLTGRVVDQAELLSADAEQRISGQLEAHEKATGNQVVVATLESLQGYDIADYGYQLGRAWGIGQAGENDGLLLIVAPNEQLVRIEVGYGLEGVMTDALSHDIIQNRILPAFREGDFEGGIEAGATAILSVLGDSYQPAADRPAELPDESVAPIILFWIFVVAVMLIRHFGDDRRSRGPGRRRRGSPWIVAPGGFGGGRGGFRGGGFSGGGGSFGGGGASGRW